MIEILEELIASFQPTPTNIVIVVALLLVAWFVFSRWEDRQ